jgi:hypothetical protein
MQQLPSFTSILGKCFGDAIPGDVAEFVQLNIRLIRIEHFMHFHTLFLGLTLLNITEYLIFIFLAWLVE